MTEFNYANASPAERAAHIAPLWLAGNTGLQIATMLGVTRNTIIGVVNRAGLLKKSTRERRPRARKPKPERKQRPALAAKAKAQPTVAEKPETETIDVHRLINTNRPPLPGASPIQLIDLPHKPFGVCRFPVQGGYCGLLCGEAKYCPDHYAIMFSGKPARATPDQIAVARQKYQRNQERALAGLAGRILDE